MVPRTHRYILLRGEILRYFEEALFWSLFEEFGWRIQEVFKNHYTLNQLLWDKMVCLASYEVLLQGRLEDYH